METKNRLRRTVRNPPERVEELVNAHVQDAKRMAWKYLNLLSSHYTQDDLESDALIGLWKAAQRWQGKGEFRGFLSRCVWRAVQDGLRKLVRNCVETEAFPLSQVASPQSQIEDIDSVASLWAETKQQRECLPLRHRVLLWLITGERLSLTQAAEVMGVTKQRASQILKSVKRRMNRASAKETEACKDTQARRIGGD